MFALPGRRPRSDGLAHGRNSSIATPREFIRSPTCSTKPIRTTAARRGSAAAMCRTPSDPLLYPPTSNGPLRPLPITARSFTQLIAVGREHHHPRLDRSPRCAGSSWSSGPVAPVPTSSWPRPTPSPSSTPSPPSAIWDSSPANGPLFPLPSRPAGHSRCPQGKPADISPGRHHG